MFGYAESGRLTARKSHPVRKLFGKFVEEVESQQTAAQGECS
jgi:hypothetical protein